MPDEARKDAVPPATVATGDPEPLEPTQPTLARLEIHPARDLPAADVASLPVVDPEYYSVEGEFARGGMGRIFRAHDRRLHRPVALKEMHSDSSPGAQRFVREALVTARLQHPSIVPVYEAGRWPHGVPFYAMKMVQGGALDGLIRTTRTLAERLALLPHVIAVAEAIAYAHSERIIHRDLTPANVLVGPFGETVVVDWGLAKDLAQASAGESPLAPLASPGGGDKTVVGTVLGTPHYMPPEQARGEAVDERADVYALGAILYHLLAGAPPHAGKTAAETLAAAKSEPPQPVETLEPDVPQELAAIVGNAMAMNPTDRYPTAREMAADLKRFQTGQLVSVHRYSAWELLKRWVRRHRATVTVAAVLTVALVVSLVAGVLGIKRQARVAEAERDKARLEAKKAQQISEFVQSMLSSADPRVQGKNVTVATVLEAAATRAQNELKDQPEVQAAVLATIGTTYEGLGLFEPAERYLKDALEARRRILGPQHRDVAGSLSKLAGLMWDKGDLQSAESLYGEAIAMFERLGLADTVEAAEAKGDLAGVFHHLGKLDEAESLHRETLALERKLLGNEHALVAGSLNNLAVVLGEKGDWAGAEALQREALAIIRRRRGPEHPDVAAGLSNLARVLEAKDDLDGAESLYREALAMKRKLLGNEHPDVAWTLHKYAFLLRRKGDPEGAVRLCREVLALRGKTLAEGHPMISAAQQVLGLSLVDLGHPPAALPILRESLELRRRSLPPGHRLIASSESALGSCLTALGRFREAEPLLVRSYGALLASKGGADEGTIEARRRVVALYKAWGKPGNASADEQP